MRSMRTEAALDRPRGEYGAHSLSTWRTFKIAFKKCFNIGVFYVAFCMENMDVFTFKPVTSFAFIFNPCKTARVQPHLSNVDTSSDFEKNPSIPKQNTPP